MLNSRTKRIPASLSKEERSRLVNLVIARKKTQLEELYARPNAYIHVPKDLEAEFNSAFQQAQNVA